MHSFFAIFGENITWLFIIMFFLFNFIIDAINKFFYFQNRKYLNPILLKAGGYVFFLGMFIYEKISIYATIPIFLLFGFELMNILLEKNLFFLRSNKSKKNEIQNKFINLIKDKYKIAWYPNVESGVTLIILVFDLIFVISIAPFLPFIYFFIAYFCIAFLLAFIKKYIIQFILYKKISRNKDGYYFENQKINIISSNSTITNKKQLIRKVDRLYNSTMREYQRKMSRGQF